MPSGDSKPMDLREAKALEIAARLKVVFSDGFWTVPSQTGSGNYRVCIIPGKVSCSCDDFSLRGEPCKHVIAARLVQERDHGGKAPAIDTNVIPKKKTYAQNWPAYNLAQREEKARFQRLLFELVRGVPELPTKGGRPRTPIADVLFAIVYKVYSTFSSRRFGTDLDEAHAKGYLSQSMHPNKVNCHLENEALTPILRELVTRSSLPLRCVEKEFAPDSSGFSTSRFTRWYDEKYGVERSGHEWVKAHILTGIKTNVVVAIEILDKNAADCPQFAPMVNTAAQHFTIEKLAGDKAYLSHDNLELVASLGGTAFIPFKTNSTMGETGGIWEKMFHFFQFKREEFLEHYHMRSNVESTFSMVKAKFRDHVRSRSDVAMRNEVYCKFICHNICCVIMEQCVLGIEAEFWEDERQEEEGEGMILKMKRNAAK